MNEARISRVTPRTTTRPVRRFRQSGLRLQVAQSPWLCLRDYLQPRSIGMLQNAKTPAFSDRVPLEGPPRIGILCVSPAPTMCKASIVFLGNRPQQRGQERSTHNGRSRHILSRGWEWLQLSPFRIAPRNAILVQISCVKICRAFQPSSQHFSKQKEQSIGMIKDQDYRCDFQVFIFKTIRRRPRVIFPATNLNPSTSSSQPAC